MNGKRVQAVAQAEEFLADARERGAEAVGENWKDVEKELFAPEEIAENRLRAALIGEFVKARQEKGISQKKLEELSGVKQPVIARMEKGNTNPQLDTVLKVLAPLGMTLAVVPLDGK